MKKLLSIILSVLMLVTVSVIGVSASLEPTDKLEGSEETSNPMIYFDVKASGWGNVKTMFCHIWRPDGRGESHAWQSKKEKCEYDTETGIATYDLTKLNFLVAPEDGNEYCVIFSANTGMQTYNTIMNGKCIGDTMYCTGEQIENPEDSEKLANVAVWQNNPDCGPEKKVTSTGNIVGTAYPDGETDVTLVATYLIQYYNDAAKLALTQDIINKLNVSPDEVLIEVKKRVGADDPYGKIYDIEKVLVPLIENETPIEKETVEKSTIPRATDAVEEETTIFVEVETTEPLESEPTETIPATNDEAPTESTDATSATGATIVTNGSSASKNSNDNGAVKTGDTSIGVIIFTILIAVTGLVITFRKKEMF